MHRLAPISSKRINNEFTLQDDNDTSFVQFREYGEMEIRSAIISIYWTFSKFTSPLLSQTLLSSFTEEFKRILLKHYHILILSCNTCMLLALDISSKWKEDADLSLHADSITFWVWLAPRERRGEMYKITPLRHAARVFKTRVLQPPVGLTRRKLMKSSFWCARRIVVLPTSDCHLYGILLNVCLLVAMMKWASISSI